MSPKISNWNLTSGVIYGSIPSRVSGGTRVALAGATSVCSSKLGAGFYEVYAMTSSNTGLSIWVIGGSTSSLTAATTDYFIPKDQTRTIEVAPGKNDYVAGIQKKGQYGSICILRMSTD